MYLHRDNLYLKNAKEGNARRVDLSQSFVKLLVSVLWVGPVFLGFAGQVFVHLVLGGLEPVDGAGLHGRVDGQEAVEVVELVKGHHDLQDTLNHSTPLLEVLSLDYQLLQVPCELEKKQENIISSCGQMFNDYRRQT